MEMTYDGAMVMPNGCVMLDEEEMTYVEGGDRDYTMTLQDAKLYFAVVVSAASGFAIGSAKIQYVGAIGTFYYGLVLSSALTCYNQCKKWLKTKSKQTKTYVTEHTILGVILGYSADV